MLEVRLFYGRRKKCEFKNYSAQLREADSCGCNFIFVGFMSSWRGLDK